MEVLMPIELDLDAKQLKYISYVLRAFPDEAEKAQKESIRRLSMRMRTDLTRRLSKVTGLKRRASLTRRIKVYRKGFKIFGGLNPLPLGDFLTNLKRRYDARGSVPGVTRSFFGRFPRGAAESRSRTRNTGRITAWQRYGNRRNQIRLLTKDIAKEGFMEFDNLDKEYWLSEFHKDFDSRLKRLVRARGGE